ncbi:fasciclin domain-containing protein [Aequorivita sp. H23M31]|uniref:Fasciclin domain-containing protein n=1 Tax=Aequorivita ciconiae TaxID=2494375 RepID=A0A410G0F6_9FLAO|nr:fasciclin domain-containing protein [Aequorivita sp. H23M31]QAA80752.1 fasciclin domain-containing protein [Aequorivita sp. H23M31]
MILKNISVLFFIILCSNVISAQKYLSKEMAEVSTQWNENKFTSTKTFAENIAEASEFTILTKILKEDPVSEEIKKNEMVTIFTVSDRAFSKMEKKQKDSLLGNKNLMNSMVKYLIVPGRIDKHGLKTEAKKHNGKFYLATLNGQKLGVIEKEDQLFLVDSEGRQAAIIDGDFYFKNGFFHIINNIILPETEE